MIKNKSDVMGENNVEKSDKDISVKVEGKRYTMEAVKFSVINFYAKILKK